VNDRLPDGWTWFKSKPCYNARGTAIASRFYATAPQIGWEPGTVRPRTDCTVWGDSFEQMCQKAHQVHQRLA
jgi:hypothetical protein